VARDVEGTKMTAQDAGQKADPRIVDNLKDWRKLEQDILHGGVIPTARDYYAGHAPFKGSALLDLRQVIDIELDRDQLPLESAAALERCRDVPTARNCWAAHCELWPDQDDIAKIMLWHAAIRGHEQACRKMALDVLGERRPFDPVGWSMMVALSLGLMSSVAGVLQPDDLNLDPEAIDDLRARGMARMRMIAGYVMSHDRADHEIETEAEKAKQAAEKLEKPEAPVDEHRLEESFLQAVEEDRAEIVRTPAGPGVVVVPFLDPKCGTSNTRDIRKAWKGIAGEKLPIVQVGDIAGAAARLTARWPHAESVIHTILEDLSHGGDIVFENTVIVGEPGTGKSALLQAIASEVGLPNTRYDLAGQADSSLMGTSARFATASESTPLQVIKQHRTASVAIVWDELEKASESTHNGSAQDALLPFLERSQARRHRDPCLEIEVDLSYVSHFATANKIEKVPAPLQDRFRIIRMPNPGWQHLGVLTEAILDEIAERKRLDRRWLPPLAPDEVDNIKDAWSGGSLRRLRRYVELTVQARERILMGRA
jgi:hypothetical protein